LLPAFESIGEEAEAVADETWEAIMSAPGTGDEEPGDYAEDAIDAGVTHYLLLGGVRQGMINLFAAALHHTFEQQVMRWLRKELLPRYEENNIKLFNWAEFKQRLKEYGIGVEEFESWPVVTELMFVAHTVKHAEGDSSIKLHRIRPDLFHPPGVAPAPHLPRVYQPLLGEDVYVTVDDVRKYRDGLLRFWDELADATSRV
jgi:hypothetical protein